MQACGGGFSDDADAHADSLPDCVQHGAFADNRGRWTLIEWKLDNTH